jgi:hypothetical protein
MRLNIAWRGKYSRLFRLLSRLLARSGKWILRLWSRKPIDIKIYEPESREVGGWDMMIFRI